MKVLQEIPDGTRCASFEGVTVGQACIFMDGGMHLQEHGVGCRRHPQYVLGKKRDNVTGFVEIIKCEACLAETEHQCEKG